ncbi:MAG TPA: thioredoxin domain-containing protein [Candidatus Binataceae bacterium]|nr:thioredoxin domain-containing protein [Candidatus Binataceae bacterium]
MTEQINPYAPLIAIVTLILAVASGGTSLLASTIDKGGNALDHRLVSFIQERFLIASPDRIKLDGAQPSPFPKLTMRPVTMVGDRGKQVRFDLFTLPASSKVLMGQLLELGKNGSEDQRLLAALRDKFHLPAATQVDFTPAVPADFGGLDRRQASAPGQQGHMDIYINPAQTYAVAGQLIDLDGDPWNKVDLSTLHLTDRATLGPADAPVTVIEFGDFECPYCAHAIQTVENAVQNTYSGKVRLIFKNFPLRGHAWAQPAAIAGECVREQNPAAFWDYVHDIYRDQSSINADNFSQHLDRFVSDHQLDPQIMHACVMGAQAENQVEQDVADGQRIHIASTPSFFVNGIPVIGDRDAATFDFVIDSALGTKGS